MQNITWAIADQSSTKFFYDAVADDGEIEKRMGRLKKTVIVVNFPLAKGGSEKIAFIKTSRGKTYRDSRTPKKNLTETEILEELTRWLGEYEATQALLALKW